MTRRHRRNRDDDDHAIADDDRVCFCGCTKSEHDDQGECVYCVDCDEFSEDVDATIEAHAQRSDL